MPEFSTPFAGNNNDKTLTEEELIRALRFSIASEFEAIQLYEQIEEATDNEEAKTLLHEIADDERVHVGNFLHLLKLLSPEDEKHYKEGDKEAIKVLNGEKDDEED